MKVYTLVGGYDYEGETLLGVFATPAELFQFIDNEKPKHRIRPERLGYDSLAWVESTLGQPVDFDATANWI